MSVCRVCYGEAEPNNELVEPCECKGSIGFIHRKCLRRWVRSTANQFRHRCELCKSPYNHLHALLEVVQEPRPYWLSRIMANAHILTAIIITAYIYIMTYYFGMITWSDNYLEHPRGFRVSQFVTTIHDALHLIPYILIGAATIHIMTLIPTFKAIRDRRRYFFYVFSFRRRYFQSSFMPVSYIFYMLSGIGLSFYFPLLGAMVTTFFLSGLFSLHCYIVNDMNNDQLAHWGVEGGD